MRPPNVAVVASNLAVVASIVGVATSARAEDRAAPESAAESAAPAAPRDAPHLDLSPQLLRAFPSRSISRDAVALAIDLAPVRRVAVGLFGAYFAAFDVPFAPGAASRPLSQIGGLATIDVKVTLVGGQTDPPRTALYLVGGTGVIFTRPVSLVEAGPRRLDYEPKLAFDVGVGGRFFMTRAFAAFAEYRGTCYFDAVADPPVGPDGRQGVVGARAFAALPTLHVGFTLHLPAAP